METKPFWQSPSFWMTIATALSLVVDKLIAGGVLPNEGWAAIVALVLGLVAKRGFVEAATVKSNALVEASKPADPPKPPQP